MYTPDVALIESRTLREQNAGKVEVLDKVKALMLLPDGTLATTEMVAAYYEVGVEAIKSIAKDHLDEVEADGRQVIEGEALRSLKNLGGISPRTGSLAVYPRRAILRVGMLLRDSVIAKRVRTAILDAEQIARDANLPEIPKTLTDALRFAADEIEKREKVIAELTPKAEQADHYRRADEIVAIGDFANDLALWARENHQVAIKHADVRAYLAELGLLIRGNTIRNNEPTAEAQKRGLMRIKHNNYETRTCGIQGSASARLTRKGVDYVWDRATARIAGNGSLKPSTAIERTAP